MAGGLAPGNPANEPDKKPVRHHSSFKPSYSHYYGALFGMCTPSYAAQAVPSDEGFKIRCNSDIDTMTLKAPMMCPVHHKKSYFYVPRKAILPNNADLLTTQPLTGEDINPDLVNTVVPLYALQHFLSRAFEGIHTVIYNQSSGTAGAGAWTAQRRIHAVLQMYELGQMFLSTASILHMTGISVYKWFQGPYSSSRRRNLTFDETLDYAISWVQKYFKEFTVEIATFDDFEHTSTGKRVNMTYTRKTYTVNLDLDGPGFDNTSIVSLRQLLDMLREGHACQIVASTLRDGYTVNDVTFIPTIEDDPFSDTFNDLRWTFAFADRALDDPSNWLNLERVIAYQLACAQWFTNDAVDAVYTTALWHQVMKSIYEASVTCIYNGWNGQSGFWQIGTLNPTGFRTMYRDGMESGNSNLPANLWYLLNGIRQEYDSVSGGILTLEIFAALAPYGTNTTPSETTTNALGWYGSSTNLDNYLDGLMYCKNLFNMQRSLRYKDYFVGSRTRPLAVGDVNVQVNDNKVNVVDVTKNIMMQRFLNQVNRIHRTLKEYSRGIFNQSPMFDPREVMFIGSTEEAIGAEETQNTGSAQFGQSQSITSHLRSNSSRFCFTFDVPEFGVIIGITTFDVPRPYVSVIDRELFHVDRFDDFNPYMQNIGDQPIFGAELDPSMTDNFGYQLRYAEYKQRLDRASGPFAGSYLPGYALIAEPSTLLKPGKLYPTLDSDFIRARSYEFDQFYLALTNNSPAGYFHFIIRDDYQVDIQRPMEAAPSIL